MTPAERACHSIKSDYLHRLDEAGSQYKARLSRLLAENPSDELDDATCDARDEFKIIFDQTERATKRWMDADRKLKTQQAQAEERKVA